MWPYKKPERMIDKLIPSQSLRLLPLGFFSKQPLLFLLKCSRNTDHQTYYSIAVLESVIERIAKAVHSTTSKRRQIDALRHCDVR